MPTIRQLFSLEVSPEKYLNACSLEEIIETWLLINSGRYQQIIDDYEHRSKDEPGAVKTKFLE